MRTIIAIIFFISVVMVQPINALKISDKQLFEELIPLHEIKKPPGPYDWMAAHPESGQTFGAYIRSRPVKPDKKRNIIYITLLGDFDPARQKVVEQTARYMEAFFDLPVKFADPISLSVIPNKARRVHSVTGDRQILTSYVIDKVLKSRMPRDAICFIAFTSSDLWPGEGWNFVFGQASIVDRVGVWSIYRNGDPNKGKEVFRLCLKRTIKTGTHEIGHMFSMHHCIFYECAMNGSNHRKESDERPLWLCPICLRKLFWALDFDLLKRYKNLGKISEEFGFETEKVFFEKSIQVLEKRTKNGKR